MQKVLVQLELHAGRSQRRSQSGAKIVRQFLDWRFSVTRKKKYLIKIELPLEIIRFHLENNEFTESKFAT